MRKLLILLCLLALLASCAQKDTALPDLSSLGEVKAVAREEGSGTRSEFESLAGTKEEGASLVAFSTSEALSIVADDKDAIGYVAYSSLADCPDTVKMLKVDGVLCDPATIKNGRYPLERKFLLCYSGELSDLELDFLTYTLSLGQAAAAELATPVKDASRFLSNGEAGTVTIAGSSSMEALLRKLIEGYSQQNPAAQIKLEVSDSSEGINKALRGEADLAASSRSLKSYESELLEAKEIALDGIAVIVNKANPMEDISLKRLRSLYSGEVKNWKDLK